MSYDTVYVELFVYALRDRVVWCLAEGVEALLLVCAHFPMTSTLIKIIISPASHIPTEDPHANENCPMSSPVINHQCAG